MNAASDILISVIVPIYQSADYLGVCINSILSQTYPNLELILIDDGSTDASGSLIDHYAENDKRIKVIHQANQGVSSARNRGLDLCIGEYILFVDSDDYLTQNAIASIVLELDINKPDVIYCGFNYQRIVAGAFMTYGKNHPDKFSATENKIIMEQFSKMYKMGLAHTPWSKAFRRSFIEAHRVRFEKRMSFGEDSCFILDVMRYATAISGLDQIIYNVVRYPMQSLSTLKRDGSTNVLVIVEKIKQLQQERGDTIYWNDVINITITNAVLCKLYEIYISESHLKLSDILKRINIEIKCINISEITHNIPVVNIYRFLEINALRTQSAILIYVTIAILRFLSNLMFHIRRKISLINY